MQRDWRNPEDYRFCEDLSPQLWAWQFLRRNPDYHKDYDWFIDRWRQLEEAYGKAPNRDFNRWKTDPLAYAPDEMTVNFCADDKSCASPDGDKVLIECAMGARWGFYKFPNSPDVEFPDVPEKLIWREPQLQLPDIQETRQSQHLDLRVDLRLPAREQLALIKRLVISRQRDYLSGNNPWSLPFLRDCLRCLDAEQAGGDVAEIVTDPEKQQFTSDQARRLMRHDYRLLTLVEIRP